MNDKSYSSVNLIDYHTKFGQDTENLMGLWEGLPLQKIFIAQIFGAEALIAYE